MKTKATLWYACLALLIAGFSFLSYHFDHPFLAMFIVIIPLAMIANGFIAEKEDEAPGGFNNPLSVETEKSEKKTSAHDSL